MSNTNCPCPPGTTAPGGERKQVSYLNQYTGYFASPEGDIPVSVVANSIQQAAKILAFPGVYSEDSAEPTVIKFTKGRIAVAAPVQTVAFRTTISPQGAIDSGAYATPAQADVSNGTQVIFTAYEPYSWKFVGWYKNGNLISTDKVSHIEIYDPYTSLIEYEARYEFDESRILRSGRYLEIGRGWIVDLKFDGWSSFAGKMVVNNSALGDYFFVITNITDTEITVQPDPTVTQPENISGVFTFEATPIGLNLICKNINLDNSLYLKEGSMLTLKWTNDLVR